MVSLLFSFRGRINRKQYWIGAGLVTFMSFVSQMLTSTMSLGALDTKDPAERLSHALGASALVLPISLLVLWCSLAIQFKRFHDRGRTGWISIVPLALNVLMVVAVLCDIFGGAPLERTVADVMPFVGLLMLTGLAFFIDLGCLPSVEGPNKYGPPPGTPGPIEPQRPSGAVDAASSLFGAQSAMDRAIAEARNPRRAAPENAATPPAPGFARATLQPAATGFGRRVTR